MAHEAKGVWRSWWEKIDSFVAQLGKSKAVNVNSTPLRDGAKEIVQDYFRIVRPDLEVLTLPVKYISTLDDLLQRLLQLSNGRNSKRSYQSVIRELRRARPNVEFERELLIGKGTRNTKRNAANINSELENLILKTIGSMVPSAALSYEQAIRDLADASRISMRGTASELREALREVLDHLAPDSDVTKGEGFKLEKNRTKPTMKQKVRFILRSRGKPRTAIAAPEAAVDRLTDGIENLTRSLYDRGSLDTHVSASQREVKQLKLYMDGVLAELLELQV